MISNKSEVPGNKFMTLCVLANKVYVVLMIKIQSIPNYIRGTSTPVGPISNTTKYHLKIYQKL